MTTRRGGKVFQSKFTQVFEEFLSGKNPAAGAPSLAAFWDEVLLLDPRGDWLESAVSRAAAGDVARVASWVPHVLAACSDHAAVSPAPGDEIGAIRAANALRLARHVLRGLFDASRTVSPFDMTSHACGGPTSAEAMLRRLLSSAITSLSTTGTSALRREATRFMLALACAGPERNPLADLFRAVDAFPASHHALGDCPEALSLVAVLSGIGAAAASASSISDDSLVAAVGAAEAELVGTVAECAASAAPPTLRWGSKLLGLGTAAFLCGAPSGPPRPVIRGAAPLLALRELSRTNPKFCALLFRTKGIPVPAPAPAPAPSASGPLATPADPLSNRSELESRCLPLFLEYASHCLACIDKQVDATASGLTALCLDTILSISSSATEAVAEFDIRFAVEAFVRDGSSQGCLVRETRVQCFVEAVVDMTSRFFRRTLLLEHLDLYREACAVVQWVLCACSFTTGPDPRLSSCPWTSLWAGLFHLLHFLARGVNALVGPAEQIPAAPATPRGPKSPPLGPVPPKAAAPRSVHMKHVIDVAVRALDLLCLALVHGDRFAPTEAVDDLWYELSRNQLTVQRLGQVCSAKKGDAANGGWKTATLMDAIATHVSEAIDSASQPDGALTPEKAHEAARRARHDVVLDTSLAPLVPAPHSTASDIGQGDGKLFSAAVSAAIRHARILLQPVVVVDSS